MIKMSFFMVLTFIMSWAPMQMLTLYRFYDENFVDRLFFPWLFFSSHWLAVSRSFVNPFIYACNNQRFRKGFVYFLFFHFLHTTPNRYHAEFMIKRFNYSSSINLNSSRLNMPLEVMTSESRTRSINQRVGSLKRGRANNYSFRSVNLVNENLNSSYSSRFLSITALTEPLQIEPINSPLKFLKTRKQKNVSLI